MVSGQASKSYRFAGAPISDQAKVWGEVSRKLEAMDSPSSSDAMQDLYRTYAVKVVELEQKCSAPADCNAAAFVIAGRIIGNHFFDKSNKLRKLWQKLIRSCSIDALELATEGAESIAIAPKEISKWLESSASATQEPFPSPGIGVDVRVEGKDVIGASLVIDDRPIHMELFRRTAPQQAAASDQ